MRLIDADKIVYSWQIDADGQEHDGVTLQSIISKMPTIEERKTGRWRRRLVDSGFNADWHCSECGWKTSLEEHGYNFCPNCGASMMEGGIIMILLTIAIVFSAIILSVEIPVFIRNRDEIDFLIVTIFLLMLLASITVLFFWRN